jgi:hypothetical protein
MHAVSATPQLLQQHGVPPACVPSLLPRVQERVEKAGGQVLYWNGHRVMGVLAMSRAIGDHCLRPYVIPEPEVRCCASVRRGVAWRAWGTAGSP